MPLRHYAGSHLFTREGSGLPGLGLQLELGSACAVPESGIIIFWAITIIFEQQPAAKSKIYKYLFLYLFHFIEQMNGR